MFFGTVCAVAVSVLGPLLLAIVLGLWGFERPFYSTLAGVCSGIASRLGLTTGAVQLAFILLTILTCGWMVFFYICCAVSWTRCWPDPEY